MRCPYLAKLEIERRKYLVGKGSDQHVGHLACFASDVEPFLEVLTPDIRIELLDKMRKSFETSAAPTKMIGMDYRLSIRFKIYWRCILFCLSQRLGSKENMYGEELLSVASVRLVQLFGGRSVLVICWKQSWFWNLDLASKIEIAGCEEHFDGKCSAPYFTPNVEVSPLGGFRKTCFKNTLSSWMTTSESPAEFTFLAYRHRNYSKAIEFVQFKERLQHSTQYILAKIESCILQLKQNAGSIETLENILISSKCEFDEVLKISQEAGDSYFTFNEDLQQRPWWTPSADKNYLSGTISGLPSHSKENLCTSSLLKEKSEANGSPTHLEASLELRSLLERYATALGYTYSDAILFVSKLSCDESSTEGVGSNIVDWLNFAVIRWLQEHINKPDDERVDVLHPAFPMTGHLHEGPGKIFNFLEAFRCSSMNDPELGAKFTEVLQNWSSLDVLRKAVNGEKETMSKFLCICEAKSKSLQALYQQIPQA
ncbi:unnamed protein product [Rhodiola kirilowii]